MLVIRYCLTAFLIVGFLAFTFTASAMAIEALVWAAGFQGNQWARDLLTALAEVLHLLPPSPNLHPATSLPNGPNALVGLLRTGP
jgi:hypothetical protein